MYSILHTAYPVAYRARAEVLDLDLEHTCTNVALAKHHRCQLHHGQWPIMALKPM
jgi:hypothetical protein